MIIFKLISIAANVLYIMVFVSAVLWVMALVAVKPDCKDKSKRNRRNKHRR